MSANLPDRGLTLDYLNRVCGILQQTGARLNSVLILQTSLAFLVLSVNVGATTLPTQYSLLGLQITLSSRVLLSGCTLVLASLLMYQLGLVRHEDRLRATAIALYASIGMTHSSLDNELTNLLETPGIATTVMAVAAEHGVNTLVWRASRLFMVAACLGLPIAAQLSVVAQLSRLRAFTLLALAVCALAVSLVHLFLYSRSGSLSASRDAA